MGDLVMQLAMDVPETRKPYQRKRYLRAAIVTPKNACNDAHAGGRDEPSSAPD